MAIAFAKYSLGRPHLRAPWRMVKKNAIAMSSLLVLAVYITTALLDSVHFIPNPKTYPGSNGEIISILDYLLLDLKTQEEKTYSAPFATQLYNKESVEQEDGNVIRITPKLKYGGAHLADIKHKWFDIRQKTLSAIIISTLVWLLLVGFFYFLRFWKRPAAADSKFPAKSMGITLLLLIVLITSMYYLTPEYHIMGTDKVGQDVLYKAIKSIRTGLLIGTLTTLITLPLSIMLGLMAGYMRGWIDDAIQYIYTTISSIPDVLLIAASILMVQVYITNHPDAFNTTLKQADMRMLSLCLILGITSWTGLCRMVRAETLKLKQTDYVTAAKTAGVGSFRIMLRHLMPNVIHIVMISVILNFSGLVLAEAVLSYVGVGVDPTTFSWGNMINTARLEMAREPIVWWSLTAAFIFMFTLVLAANLFADVLREAFNPRAR